MRHQLFLATALLALSTQVNAAGVNLVTNGSFENPDIPTGTWSVHNAISGWTTTGAGVEIRDNVVGTAYDGEQFAELDSHSNSAIQQILNTTFGQSYLLSFAYSPRIGQPEDTNGISVTWNGVELGPISNTGGSSHIWTVFDFMVTGTGSDILEFAALGIDDSLGGSLDRVSVSAVPIPAAAFLFAPALLGFMGLRRKAKNSVA